MAAVNSTMLELGTPLPTVELPDATGTTHRLPAHGAPATVVAFLCNHCPFVKHLARELGLVTQGFLAKGVAVVGVNSNDTDAYPDDAPPKMLEMARAHGWDFPYLVDADQSVAHAFRAACTPDFYVFGADGRLTYRGRFDASRPGNDEPVTGADLKAAVAGAQPPAEQVPSIGCNIKWRPGREPEWFG